jgi:hypothetical protein
MQKQTYPYIPQINRYGSIDYAYRPLVKIEVSSRDRSEKFMGLVDSGTDITMIDVEIAELLGIDVSSLETASAFGIGEGIHKAFLGEVILAVPEFEEKIVCNVLFVEKLGFQVILGQQDFFRRFIVSFEKHNNTFSLTLAPTQDEK